MLIELHIKNFAIIDDLSLKFGPGLTTFTGETGAGKSIIIDAVETILGSRVDTNMIRTEADQAFIEGTFFISPKVRKPLHAILNSEELLDDPDYIILAREIRQQGRHIARVNGRATNLSLLRKIGDYLIDVHGQSEHLSLLRVSEHIRLLDEYASVERPLGEYRETYNQLATVRKALYDLREAESDAARRMDLLEYQINEIVAAHLEPGEEKNLRNERTRLANAETLTSTVQESLFLLDQGDSETQAITDLFGQIVEGVASLVRTDPSISQLATHSQELFESLVELARELSDYADGIEFSPKRLEQVEERLDLIHNLNRKYGGSIPEVLAFLEKASRELENITNAEDRILELEGEENILLVELAKRGQALSRTRHTAADSLSESIEVELDLLRMEESRFQAEFQTLPDPDGLQLDNGEKVAFYPNGIERVQFLIAPNPGEGFKPLAKIASGGETSRLMLALKNVLSKADSTPTLIFDEIDQGVGGRVGSIVGEKLWALAQQHQVLCITHLPQLAAYGAQHFRVEKMVREGRTSTRLEKLESNERLIELAQMLGTVSESTLQSAQELVEQVNQRIKIG